MGETEGLQSLRKHAENQLGELGEITREPEKTRQCFVCRAQVVDDGTTAKLAGCLYQLSFLVLFHIILFKWSVTVCSSVTFCLPQGGAAVCAKCPRNYQPLKGLLA